MVKKKIVKAIVKKVSDKLKKKKPKVKSKPKKTRPKKPPGRKKIDLRGGAKTNPDNPRSTRSIAQVAKDPRLKGREKTLAIQEAIRNARSPFRTKGTSNPSKGLAFKAMYDAGLKPVRRKGRMVLDKSGAPVTRKPPGRKKLPSKKKPPGGKKRGR
tara:strand:- start:76 stop:543 length:468 start_codon:yes stop_codon:yes gene_type:complete